MIKHGGLTLFLASLVYFSFSQNVPDVSFTDNEGNSYNLYELLDTGQSVVLHYTSTG